MSAEDFPQVYDVLSEATSWADLPEVTAMSWRLQHKICSIRQEVAAFRSSRRSARKPIYPSLPVYRVVNNGIHYEALVEEAEQLR